MQRLQWAMIFVTAVLGLADEAAAQRRGAQTNDLPARYCWLSDYQDAKTVAQKSGEPMMVVFRCVP